MVHSQPGPAFAPALWPAYTLGSLMQKVLKAQVNGDHMVTDSLDQQCQCPSKLTAFGQNEYALLSELTGMLTGLLASQPSAVFVKVELFFQPM